MRGEVKIQQRKLAQRRRKRLLRIVGLVLLGFIILIAAVAYAIDLPALALDSVSVSGNARISSTTIAAIADRDISGDYLHIFSKRDFLIYPAGAIERDILAFPEIEKASVSRAGVHKLDISVVERAQDSLWCDGPVESVAAIGATSSRIVRSDAPEKCYAMDRSGFVFAPAERDASSTDVVYRGLATGEPIGMRILPEAEFSKIRFFISELPGMSVYPEDVDLSGSTTSPYMVVRIAGGGRLIFDAGDDLSASLGYLSAILSDRSIATSSADFLTRLDYLRLDDENRLVYKLK